MEEDVIAREIERLTYLYWEYQSCWMNFQRFSQEVRELLYSVDFEAEEDLGRWLDHLEKAGHTSKPEVTMVYDPQISKEEYARADEGRMRYVMKVWMVQQDSAVSPTAGVRPAHSTPQSTSTSS